MLIKRLCFFFICLLSFSAMADYPAVPKYGDDYGTDPNARNQNIANQKPEWDSAKPISCTLYAGSCMSNCKAGTASPIGSVGQTLGDIGTWSCPVPVPTCPQGGTLSEDKTTCIQDACASRAQNPPSYVWYSSPVGQPSVESSQYCDSGCQIGLNPAPTGTAYSNSKFRIQRYQRVELGYACTPGTGAPPSPNPPGVDPPEPPKKPPCLPTEGVLTSTSGTVACVPSGTPGNNPPVVSKKTDVQNFPDGSKKTTEETTTRDPDTGAESKDTKVTATEKSGGGAGQAGDPGTSQGTSEKSKTGQDKTGNNDFCETNPTLDICTGNLNKEETQKKIKEAIDKVKDAVSAENFEAATYIKDPTLSESVNAQIKAAVDEYKAHALDLSTGGPVAGNQQTFKEQMGGWIEPITNSGCHAFDVKVGAWNWHHDHCAEAAKISEMGAYCLWVILAFSVFNMTTRGAR